MPAAIVIARHRLRRPGGIWPNLCGKFKPRDDAQQRRGGHRSDNVDVYLAEIRPPVIANKKLATKDR